MIPAKYAFTRFIHRQRISRTLKSQKTAFLRIDAPGPMVNDMTMGEMTPFLKRDASVPKTRLILVTGMAGAGKTSALAALADLGFETVDNPPVNLIEAILDDYAGSGARLAIGVDGRSRGFSTERCADVISALRNRSEIDVTLVFLECANETLLRRFQ